MIAFDAEPLIAYYGDEPGSDAVEARLRAVERGDRTGLINSVTCTEVLYVLGRDDPEAAELYCSRVRTWFRVVEAEAVWRGAADFKRRYGIALGDAYTLATADTHDATAFVGADDDYDEITEVEIERFRSEGV